MIQRQVKWTRQPGPSGRFDPDKTLGSSPLIMSAHEGGPLRLYGSPNFYVPSTSISLASSLGALGRVSPNYSTQVDVRSFGAWDYRNHYGAAAIRLRGTPSSTRWVWALFSTDGIHAIELSVTTGRNLYAYYRDSGWTIYAAQTTRALEIGRTYIVALKHDAVAKRISIYIDGVLETTATGSPDYHRSQPSYSRFYTYADVEVAWYATGNDLRTDRLALVGSDPWAIFKPRRTWAPQAEVVALPTLSLPTYVPGSLTATGFRPRVTAS